MGKYDRGDAPYPVGTKVRIKPGATKCYGTPVDPEYIGKVFEVAASKADADLDIEVYDPDGYGYTYVNVNDVELEPSHIEGTEIPFPAPHGWVWMGIDDYDARYTAHGARVRYLEPGLLGCSLVLVKAEDHPGDKPVLPTDRPFVGSSPAGSVRVFTAVGGGFKDHNGTYWLADDIEYVREIDLR